MKVGRAGPGTGTGRSGGASGRPARRASVEQLVARVFDASPDYIAVARLADGRIMAVNRAFERVTGYGAREAVGRTAAELGLWAQPDDRASFIEDLKRHGSLHDRPVQLRVKGGNIVYGLMSASLTKQEGEELIVGVVHDTTEAKLLERRARQSERKFAALFESSPEAITLLRLSDGVRLAANAAWESFTGYPRNAAIGQPAAAMPLFRDPARRAALIARAEAEGGFSSLDARLVRADGAERDASVSAVLIELDGERCILWTWRDVTAERRAESDREAADARYRALFESTMDGIVILSPDWKFVDVNPSALRLSGYAREEVVGRSVDLVLDADELDRNPLNPARQWVLVERELTMKNGRKRPIEVMSGALPDGNILGVVRDITERKRAEMQVRRMNRSLEEKVRERTAELEDANRELDSFNFSVSHDLRQPLNAIGGFADLLHEHLGKGDGDSEVLQYAREILANAERMEHMIRALLELSRAGRGALTRTSVDMRRQVEAVVRDLAAGGILRAQVCIGDLPPARGDETLLRQVWCNLIGNAVKYSAKSPSPRIDVGGTPRGGSIEYAVRDNGIGFDMRHADRLFGVFQRLPGSAGFEGAGVGLAIVERIVHRHGGRVGAESAPGQGTTIRFALPA